MNDAAPIAHPGAPAGSALLLFLLLCACPKSQNENIEPPDDGIEAEVPVAEEITPQPRKPVARDDYTSLDGLVRAPRPQGEDWQCLEQTARPPKPPATLIKCRLTDPKRFFFLMAKDYEVPPDQRLPVDAIVRDLLPQTYAKLFRSHTISEVKEIEHQGVQGIALTVDAEHKTIGQIHRREHLFVRGNHVLVISAEGSPEFFDLFAAEIDAWMLGVAFINLSLQ